jgi:hypothetical protein
MPSREKTQLQLVTEEEWWIERKRVFWNDQKPRDQEITHTMTGGRLSISATGIMVDDHDRIAAKHDEAGGRRLGASSSTPLSERSRDLYTFDCLKR